MLSLILILMESSRVVSLRAYYTDISYLSIDSLFGSYCNELWEDYGLLGINTSDMSVEEAQLRYQVPYVIWANYDIEEETQADTDISFLAAKMFEKAKIPTSAYQNFLLELEKNPDSKALLEQYNILQYYFMFDYQEE